MISVNLANKILNYIIGFETSLSSSTGKCYLGFSTQDPGSDGSAFTEPDPEQYPSYARIQLNISSASQYTNKWGTVADKQVALAEEIVSPECLETGGWPTFTHFGIFNAKEIGSPIAASLMAWDLLTDPDGEPDEDGQYPPKALNVGLNEVAVFRIGALKLTFK